MAFYRAKAEARALSGVGDRPEIEPNGDEAYDDDHEHENEQLNEPLPHRHCSPLGRLDPVPFGASSGDGLNAGVPVVTSSSVSGMRVDWTHARHHPALTVSPGRLCSRSVTWEDIIAASREGER